MTWKLWWWLTPLGRVRLALARAQDPAGGERALEGLRSALALLRRPSWAASPRAADLLPQVLERLTELSLQRGEPMEAAGYLSQMDACAPAATVLPLRWRIVRELVRDRWSAAAVEQARLYVERVESPAGNVAGLLAGALAADAAAARQVAEKVHPRRRGEGVTGTLWQLCALPETLGDPDAAAALAARLRPELLEPWPALQSRAHVVRARCAELGGRWEPMLAEAETAEARAPEDVEPRYWRIRALLHTGRAAEARRAAEAGPADPSWERLRAVAALAAEPGLDRADACTRVLEEAWGKPEPPERDLALAALEPALRPAVDAPEEQLATVAGLCERLLRAAGPLSWIGYGLALWEIRFEGSFEKALERLRAGATAPEGGCPAHLLRAAGAAVLGRTAELAEALDGAAEPVPERFAADAALLGAISGLCRLLRGDRTADPAGVSLLEPGLAARGPLARSMPLLGSLGDLLAELAARTTGRGGGPLPAAETLEGSVWASWVRQRLWTMGSPVPEVGAVLARAEGPSPHPALAWERAGWLQEYRGQIPGWRSSIVEGDLARSQASLAGARRSLWNDLFELRRGLASPAETMLETRKLVPAPCPWFPEDGPLQELARREAQIEFCYLEGRHALRRGAPGEALAELRRAREACPEGGLGAFLTAGRFSPVLDYWEGVALAHGGSPEEARTRLRGCLAGPKGAEAAVQLGLVELAGGDLEAAADCLRQSGEPLSGSALYLAALLAERRGQDDSALHLLDRIVTADAQEGSVYAAAAWRLRGALAERQGSAARAAEQYRHALVLWPGDRAAAARLGRIWLHEAWEGIGADPEVRPEPALHGLWDDVAGIGWAAPLVQAREWLGFAAAGARGDTRVAAPQDPAGAGLRRLALWSLLTAGRLAQARAKARAWAAEAPEEDGLAAADAILEGAAVVGALWKGRPSRKLWEEAGQAALRLAVLRERRPEDRGLAFWNDVIRLALDPGLAETGELFPDGMAEGEGLRPRRAFAAVAGLFAEGPERRRAAAALARELFATEALAGTWVQNAAACLVAFAAGSEDELLDRYAAVEERVEELPCDPAGLYVAACEARLRAGAVDAITHGVIPDSLADLTHPEVRRVVGSAYAVRAARSAERDVRAALKDCKQALELLDVPGDNPPGDNP